VSDEFRHANRRRLEQQVNVYDTVAEQVIGKLINLSETGMSMVAFVPMVNDALYQLRFEIADGAGPRVIDVGAHELWASPAVGGDQSWVGLRFIAVSPTNLTVIRDWVNAPGAELV
jgi:hypothetical protein